MGDNGLCFSLYFAVFYSLLLWMLFIPQKQLTVTCSEEEGRTHQDRTAIPKRQLRAKSLKPSTGQGVLSSAGC